MAAVGFKTAFSSVQDPRLSRGRLHELIDILFIAVAGTISGCEGAVDLQMFGEERLDWFRKFVPLKNGIPSHDTICRVLSLVKPFEFQEAFIAWIQAMLDPERTESDDGDVRFVPIDGKSLRGSADKNQNPLHLVSAWATQQGISLGQVAVDSKSNEITAIPKLLEMLELKGAMVTLDAMGCQRSIAKKIIRESGDYLLAVKKNQKTLSTAIHDFFSERHEHDDFAKHRVRQFVEKNQGHGRWEERHYYQAPLPKSMQHLAKTWRGLRSIGQVITITREHGVEKSQVRIYISSRTVRVKEFAKAVRNHWSIESMHWILDVVFREDDCRIKTDDAPENFAALRKFVLSVIKQDTSKGSLRGKRKRAGWSTKFLEKILFQGIL